MKQYGVFLLFMLWAAIVSSGTIAQTRGEAKSIENSSMDDKDAQTTPAQPTATSTIAPEGTRRYPIAAGVWYPGDPVPTVPSRYYRVRCWPGCHSYGEWANKPKTEQKTPKLE